MGFPQLTELCPVLACITLAVLLFAGERTGNLRVKWLFKPLTSALFVLTALLRNPVTGYDWLVVTGLGLSMAGDIALIRRDRRWFLAGLVVFLLGHVAYTVAFGTRADMLALHPAALAAIAVASIAVFLYFRPHLAGMARPVAAYVAVITLMLASAWSLAWSLGGSDATAWLIASGATLFYVSDFTVARDRFMSGAGFSNRATGLVLYYVAQFLFAFSIGR
jgi:uncharacterized membrane protein YhhN